MKAYLDPVLACLDAQIATLEADIQTLIRIHAPLKRAAATLRTIAGIGETTAATLLALMPEPKDRASELGTLTGKQAASLAGLAPHPRQSGALDGYRRTRGGRPKVRPALFMAALSGSRYDPHRHQQHQFDHRREQQLLRVLSMAVLLEHAVDPLGRQSLLQSGARHHARRRMLLEPLQNRSPN